MRLLEKHKHMLVVAEKERHRYSRAAEHYCYLRTGKAYGGKREHELFWINMHYLYGLMLPYKEKEKR